MTNGDRYIFGVGGYNGKNITEAKTLQEVITELSLGAIAETRIDSTSDNDIALTDLFEEVFPLCATCSKIILHIYKSNGEFALNLHCDVLNNTSFKINGPLALSLSDASEINTVNFLFKIIPDETEAYSAVIVEDSGSNFKCYKIQEITSIDGGAA